MLRQKNHLTSELIEEEPVVLILAEEKTPLLDKLLLFFDQQGIKTRVCLSSDFINNDQALKIYQELKQTFIYKVLVLAGWQKKYVKNFSNLNGVLTTISQSLAEDGQILPLFFLLNYSSPLRFLGNDWPELSIFWQEQELFLSQIIKEFPLANYCLLEDFVEESVFCPHFNLLLAGFAENFIIDCGQDFYWQDYRGLMENFARLFFQSQGVGKYLLRGKKNAVKHVLDTFKNNLEQYFRKDFQIWKIQVESVTRAAYLADFITLYGKGGLVEKKLDEQVRLLPHSLSLAGGVKKSLLMTSKAPKPALKIIDKPTPILLINEPKKELKPAQTKTKVGSSPPTSLPIKKNGDNVGVDLKPAELVDEKLASIFQNKQKQHQKDRFKKNLQGAKTIVKKNRHRKIMFYIGVSIFSIGNLAVLLFANFFLSQLYLQNKLFAALRGINSSSNQQLEDLNKGLIYSSFSWQTDQYQRLLGKDQLAEAEQYRQIFNQVARSADLAKDLEQERFNLFQAILKTEGDVGEIFGFYLNLESELYEERRLLNQTLDTLNLDNFSSERASLLGELKSKNLKLLKTQQRSISLIKPLLGVLSGPSQSNLVFLIQDNSELRASGGFLSNLLVFSFENGHLLNWENHAVGELDQQVYGDRQANEEIKVLLGGERLFLRDANWLANFSEAGQDIAWFIEQSLGFKPDLMITLGSKDLLALLGLLGPLRPADQEINANNFFEKINDDKLLINDLSKTLFAKFLEGKASDLNYFIDYLTMALEKKESYLYSSDEALKQIIRSNLWAGELLNTPCPSEFAGVGENCFLDGIFQLENNISLNKSNRLIVEKIDHAIGVSENFIRHKRKLSLQNLSRQNLYPEGDYQGYFKFYLPKTIRLEKITVTNELGQEKSLSASEYSLTEVGEKAVLGLRLSVGAGKTILLELTYVLAHQLKSPFSYVFLEQKQPGLFNKNIQYRLLFAEEFKPQLIAPQATYEDKIIEFNNNNQDNFIFGVAF